MIDYIFGYDFFISYAHADGKVYPRQLAQALTLRKFSVFLDEEVYSAGDELPTATLRRVNQSRRLILIYGPSSAGSLWVRREVETYASRPDVPLVVEWDVTLATDSEALWLREMLGETLTIREHVSRADQPSPETVDNLIRSFRARRVEHFRTTLFAIIALIFAVLAAVAWVQRARAVAEARRATSARLAMESNFALASDPQKATAIAECAISAEPLAVSRESLTAAVRATWGAQTVFRARSGSLREAVVIPSTGMVIATGQAGLLWTWAGHGAEPISHRLLNEDLTSLALTASGDRLLVGSSNGSLQFLDTHTFLPARPPIRLHNGGISRILVLGPRLIATVGYDEALVFLDPESGAVIARPPVFHQPGTARLGIQDAAFDPTRRRIVTAGADGRLALWDVADPQRTHLLATAGPASPPGRANTVWFSVAIEPSSGLVAGGDGYGMLRIWRQEGDQLRPVELAVPDPPADVDHLIAGLAFDSASGLLAVARSDGSLSLWDVGGDLKKGDLPGPLLQSYGHGSAVNRVSFTAPAQTLTAGDDGHVVQWRFRGLSAPPLPFRPVRGGDTRATLSRNGAFLAGWDERNIVKVWSLQTHATIGSVSWDPRRRIWVTAVSKDGEQLAIGDETGTVVVWAAKAGHLLLPPQDIHAGNVTALTFDPVASRWLLSGDVDGSVVKVRLDGGSPTTQPLVRLGAQVSAIAVSADGSVVAAVPSTGGSIRLWRTRDWVAIGDIAVDPGSGIRDAALDSRGEHLALADRWGFVLLFDRQAGSWVRRQLVHGGQVRAVAFSPNGDLLASGGDDGRIVVWSTATGARQWVLPRAHASMVDAVAWRPDQLVSVGFDGSVASWPVSLSWWTSRAAQVAPAPTCPY